MEDLSSDANYRRLFFGAQIEASWPKDLPSGRILSEEIRHITLAFLGKCLYSSVEKILPNFPIPPFLIGPSGIAGKLIFLPEQSPRVAAAAVHWPHHSVQIDGYRKQLVTWLSVNGFATDQRSFLPHITIARTPLDQEQWKNSFHPFAFFINQIHLYESIPNGFQNLVSGNAGASDLQPTKQTMCKHMVDADGCKDEDAGAASNQILNHVRYMGHLTYRSLFSYALTAPFEEIDHTADIAFIIRGATMQELHWNAQIALSFKHPEIIPYFSSHLCTNLDDIIIALNEMIAGVDSELGSPFKAVSFHGHVRSDSNHLLLWEMIVDV